MMPIIGIILLGFIFGIGVSLGFGFTKFIGNTIKRSFMRE